MASPSVTYTFSNGTTADATQVNQNFTDLINGLTDGTKDLSISAITAAGNATFNGNTTIGNASGDDLTITASLASDIPIKTTATYNFGSSTKGLAGLYLGNSTFTTKLATAATASWTFTLPTTSGTAGYGLLNSGSGTVAWKPMMVDTAAKSADYTITDSDAVRSVLMTTGGSDRVVTLPAAANNAGRLITVKKIDSTTTVCTVKGAASGETIDGTSGTTGIKLYFQNESISVQSDGSVWVIVAARWASGTYTPSLTNTTNISSSTAFASQFTRNGSIVSVSAKVNITASGSNNRLRISLPISSSFTAEEQGAGTGAPVGITTEPPFVRAVASNTVVEYGFSTADTGSRSHYVHFIYSII